MMAGSSNCSAISSAAPTAGPPASTPASGRLELCTKSPATGLWLDSNAGGSLGPELKYAGYDALIISGAAEAPVLLLIEDERVAIVEAGDYWGLDTITTHKKLKTDYSVDHRVACIGQSGELLSPLANVQTEYRSFGRGGAGAVMGAKNLKQHFFPSWNYQPVGSGDEISLGRRTLSFLETRMLHWPDSMFTYLQEDKILFSSDAFGQHYAGPEKFDDEIGDRGGCLDDNHFESVQSDAGWVE